MASRLLTRDRRLIVDGGRLALEGCKSKCCGGATRGTCCIPTDYWNLCRGNGHLFPCPRGADFRGKATYKEDSVDICFSTVPPAGGPRSGSDPRSRFERHIAWDSDWQKANSQVNDCTPEGCTGDEGDWHCWGENFDYDETEFVYYTGDLLVYHNEHVHGCSNDGSSGLRPFAFGTDPLAVFLNFYQPGRGCTTIDPDQPEFDFQHSCSYSQRRFFFDATVGLVEVTPLTWELVTSCNYTKMVFDQAPWSRVVDGWEYSGVYHAEFEWVGHVNTYATCRCFEPAAVRRARRFIKEVGELGVPGSVDVPAELLGGKKTGGCAGCGRGGGTPIRLPTLEEMEEVARTRK